jgi:hypothetical protein
MQPSAPIMPAAGSGNAVNLARAVMARAFDAQSKASAVRARHERNAARAAATAAVAGAKQQLKDIKEQVKDVIEIDSDSDSGSDTEWSDSESDSDDTSSDSDAETSADDDDPENDKARRHRRADRHRKRHSRSRSPVASRGSIPKTASVAAGAVASPLSPPVIYNPLSIKEAPKSSNEDDQCPICMTGRKRHVLCEPCGHTPICLQCLNLHRFHRCPEPSCGKGVAKWTVST